MENPTLLLCSLLITCLLRTAPVHAQTLFWYGDHAVGKAEFLKAYQKNNSDSNGLKMSYGSYLDLYAKFRMKVQAAHDEKLDTTAQQHAEVRAFRDQLAEGFLKEDASIRLLIDEAASRSRTDIHLTDLYVPVAEDARPADLAQAAAAINAAYASLNKGEPFDQVAARYHRADLGYITAFVLPYAIETIAYNTPAGGYARPFKTSQGFHIFHPLDRRKALGKVRVAQILLAFKPDAGETDRRHVAERADSVYRALTAGASFPELAGRLSDDNLSYQTDGELPVFGVGKYDSAFEHQAFALRQNGEISKPFATAFGYHILKRIGRIPVVENTNDKEWRAEIRERVEQSDRMSVAQAMLLQHIRQTIKKDAPPSVMSSDTFSLSFYRDHLEQYNAEFASQLQEFSEGNLLFTIMQKKVWDPASADTVALMKYFQEHRDRYRWSASVEALIISGQHGKEVQNAFALAKTNAPSWRQWADAANGQIQIDSGRYEIAQVPGLTKNNLSPGVVTNPVVNMQDSATSFGFVIAVHRGTELKTFDDARGAVINDYQIFLENQWMAILKEKYPVRVNKKVLAGLPGQ